MPLLIASIFFGIMGSFIGSALLDDFGLISGSMVGFFAPSIVALWNVYQRVCDSEKDEKDTAADNDEDDGSENDDLIGDEWKI